MLPRSGQIVRPLLELTRQQTRAYVTARGWVAQDDPTNASRRFDRNRLRLDVMPILRAFRPGARPNLQRAARLLGAEREALARYAAQLLIAHWQIPRPEQALDGLAAGVLHLDDWPALPEPERWLVLRAFLARVGGDLRDVGLADIERSTLSRSGRPTPAYNGLANCDWDAAMTVWCGRGRVPRVGPGQATGRPYREHPRDRRDHPGRRGRGGPDRRLTCEGELAARPPRPGDRLRPAGRGGSRKVRRAARRAGVPVQVRPRVPVVVCGEVPVWLPGVAAPKDGAARAGSGCGTDRQVCGMIARRCEHRSMRNSSLWSSCWQSSGRGLWRVVVHAIGTRRGDGRHDRSATEQSVRAGRSHAAARARRSVGADRRGCELEAATGWAIDEAAQKSRGAGGQAVGSARARRRSAVPGHRPGHLRRPRRPRPGPLSPTPSWPSSAAGSPSCSRAGDHFQRCSEGAPGAVHPGQELSPRARSTGSGSHRQRPFPGRVTADQQVYLVVAFTAAGSPDEAEVDTMSPRSSRCRRPKPARPRSASRSGRCAGRS